jgi:hypothetical protein
MDAEQTTAAAESPQTQQEKPKRTGIGEMREAADLVLDVNCIDIAVALIGLETRANATGVKLLFDLAKEKEARGEETPGLNKVRSSVAEWAAEQEWQAESSEDAAETAAGSREPEQ